MEITSIELVIVYSLHHTLVSNQRPLYWARHLVKGLTKALDNLNNIRMDVRVGLVTYGGRGKWKEPRAILLEGKFLRTPRQAYHHILADVQPGLEEIDASQAILTGSDFPFRKASVKVVFLIHDGQSPGSAGSKADNSHLLKVLKSRDVVLVTSAPYAQFIEQGPIGLWANGELIVTGPTTSHPTDPYNDVIKSTGGFWLDWNALRQKHRPSRTKSRGLQARNDVIETVVTNLHRLATDVQTKRCHA
ncbi:hypothetical protein ElyMa_006885800 [Elysia marginata]|uniref:VWFA domain-containing protein n=1 Tax=Elysia marginata TaxID=1093978 RepID=A0AAV4JDD1_9GAST|nr:hypothetical protein ElyMa_006885800 [Elysia marginata]